MKLDFFIYFRLEFLYNVKRKSQMDPRKIFWGVHSDLLNMGNKKLRRQSGRVKRYTYSYVSLLRPTLPKARSRGGLQLFVQIRTDYIFFAHIFKSIGHMLKKLRAKVYFFNFSEMLKNPPTQTLAL